MRWTPWIILGAIIVAWWSYASPASVAKRLRSAAAEPREASASSLVAARVDFARVNAQLTGDLQAATKTLNPESFSYLLLHGWLPQQKEKKDAGKAAKPDVEDNPAPDSVSGPALQTRLYRVRYKALNRAIAIYWDAYQMHEVVLTLQRESLFHRWQVTKVYQFNICAYDFDCALVSPAEAQALASGGSTPAAAD